MWEEKDLGHPCWLTVTAALGETLDLVAVAGVLPDAWLTRATALAGHDRKPAIKVWACSQPLW